MYTDKPMTSMVKELLFNSDNPVTGVRLAEKIGRKYQTLMRELNPMDRRAKLSVDVFADLVKETGRIALLEKLAEYAGFSIEVKKLG
jgi:hypothetical protein